MLSPPLAAAHVLNVVAYQFVVYVTISVGVIV
jgi:hypothetical protein